jgi:integrase
MRVEEFWELVEHPHWFSASRRCIDLPKGAIGKARCKMQERTIMLSPEGANAIQTMIGCNGSMKYVDRSNMRKYLRTKAEEAGISKEGITSKMFRKCCASWLIATMPEKVIYITSSMGHSTETMQIHYLGMGFLRKDVEDMRKFFRGWGE